MVFIKFVTGSLPLATVYLNRGGCRGLLFLGMKAEGFDRVYKHLTDSYNFPSPLDCLILQILTTSKTSEIIDTFWQVICVFVRIEQNKKNITLHYKDKINLISLSCHYLCLSVILCSSFPKKRIELIHLLFDWNQ